MGCGDGEPGRALDGRLWKPQGLVQRVSAEFGSVWFVVARQGKTSCNDSRREKIASAATKTNLNLGFEGHELPMPPRNRLAEFVAEVNIAYISYMFLCGVDRRVVFESDCDLL